VPPSASITVATAAAPTVSLPPISATASPPAAALAPAAMVVDIQGTTTQSIDKGKRKLTKKDDETNTAIQATKSESVQANHTAEKGKGSAKDGEVKKKPGRSKCLRLNTYVELEEEYKEDEWAGLEAEEEEGSGAEGKSQEDNNDNNNNNNNNNNNDLAALQGPCAACKHCNLECTMSVLKQHITSCDYCKKQKQSCTLTARRKTFFNSRAGCWWLQAKGLLPPARSSKKKYVSILTGGNVRGSLQPLSGKLPQVPTAVGTMCPSI
jgi:hypothetical protein